MTKTAHLNDNVPEKYRGMDRYEARKAVIEDLKAQGLLVGIKPHKHMVPLVPRTGEVVEPMISEQWFLAMSQPRSGRQPLSRQVSVRPRFGSCSGKLSQYLPRTVAEGLQRLAL